MTRTPAYELTVTTPLPSPVSAFSLLTELWPPSAALVQSNPERDDNPHYAMPQPPPGFSHVSHAFSAKAPHLSGEARRSPPPRPPTKMSSLFVDHVRFASNSSCWCLDSTSLALWKVWSLRGVYLLVLRRCSFWSEWRPVPEILRHRFSYPALSRK